MKTKRKYVRHTGPFVKPCAYCRKDFEAKPGPQGPSNFARKKFCSQRCGHDARSARTVYDPAVFWAKVDQSAGPDACWPYTGYVTPEGYGWAWTGLPKDQQQTHGAHRQAWINTYGPIPKGKLVCHHCDYPRCCNPKHLFIGTVADNTADMIKKGRHYGGANNPRKKAVETT